MALLADEVPLQFAAVDLVQVVRDRLVSPRDRALQWVHHRDVHDRADVGQVSFRDPKIERTERFGRHNAGTILQVGKPVLEHVIHLWTKGKVVDKHYRGGGNCCTMFRTKEVSLVELVLRIFLSIPAHPALKENVHRNSPVGGDLGFFYANTQLTVNQGGDLKSSHYTSCLQTGWDFTWSTT